MNLNDIHNLISLTTDTDGYQFAKEIYNIEEPDEYTRGKFSDMQKHLIRWVASLDYKNRERLAKAINNQAERKHPKLYTEELMGFIDELMEIVGNYRDKPMNDDYTYQHITGTYKMFKHLQKQKKKENK